MMIPLEKLNTIITGNVITMLKMLYSYSFKRKTHMPHSTKYNRVNEITWGDLTLYIHQRV